MEHPADRPRRHPSLRWDQLCYSGPGRYFVTTCVAGRACVLGDVVDGQVVLSARGRIVEEEWLRLPQRFPTVRLAAFVVMPNHVHGIVVIVPPGRPHLGRIVGAFKGVSASRISALRGRPHAKFWQRGYYDRLIREGEYDATAGYIRRNPARWKFDPDNPLGSPIEDPLDRLPWDEMLQAGEEDPAGFGNGEPTR